VTPSALARMSGSPRTALAASTSYAAGVISRLAALSVIPTSAAGCVRSQGFRPLIASGQDGLPAQATAAVAGVMIKALSRHWVLTALPSAEPLP
jgi:hypothetical protein